MYLTREQVAKTVAELAKAIESDDLPETVAKTVIIAKDVDKPSSKWSPGNRFWMLLNGTLDARGYNQWKQVGRHVKKGAKAFYILAPVTKVITVKVTDEETGEEREEKRQVLAGFTGVPVFRYEDTEGKPLPQPDYKPVKLPPLFDVAKFYGINVEWLPDNGEYYGMYYLSGDRIELRTHDEDTFWHELAHAAHHRLRGELKGGQEPDQEMVASLAAAVIASLYGYKLYIRRNVEYAKSYARLAEGKDPVKILRRIFKVLGEVEAVVLKILEDAEKAAAAKAAA